MTPDRFVVVVPARDEAPHHRLHRLDRALGGSGRHGSRPLRDRHGRRLVHRRHGSARPAGARRRGVIIEVTRRIGRPGPGDRHAHERSPGGSPAAQRMWTVHTDADSVVPEGWLHHQRRVAEIGFAAVAGVVEIATFAEHGREDRSSPPPPLHRPWRRTPARPRGQPRRAQPTPTGPSAAGRPSPAARTTRCGTPSAWLGIRRCRPARSTSSPAGDGSGARPTVSPPICVPWVRRCDTDRGRCPVTPAARRRCTRPSDSRGWPHVRSVRRTRQAGGRRGPLGGPPRRGTLRRRGDRRRGRPHVASRSAGRCVGLPVRWQHARRQRACGRLAPDGRAGVLQRGGHLDLALVDARLPDGAQQLFAVPLGEGVAVDIAGWRTPALAATGTGRTRFDATVDADAAIGDPGLLPRRPGFWHGAIGVAAVWAGGATAIHSSTVRRVDTSNPHAAANVGRTFAEITTMTLLLSAAGDHIDRSPDSVGMAEALAIRHVVAAGCRDVIASSQRATGPGPQVFDDAHAQRIADLGLYIEQHHHEADLAQIGRSLSPERRAGSTQ